MSFLGALGKIGKGLLGAVPVIGDVASVLGSQEGGKANAKQQQALLGQAQDRNALDRYQAEQGAQFTAANQDLARKNYERSEGVV